MTENAMEMWGKDNISGNFDWSKIYNFGWEIGLKWIMG